MRFAYVHWYQHVGGWGRVPLEWENWTIDVCLSEAVEFNICIMCRLNVGWKKCWMELSWEEWIPSGECILQQQWQLRRLSWIDWSWISQWLLLGLLVQTEICRTLQDLLRAQSPARQQDVSFNSIGHCTTIKYFTSYLFSVSTPIYALQSASTRPKRGKGHERESTSKAITASNVLPSSTSFSDQSI